MISRTYNIHERYAVALYLRMSDPKQNRRSPDQQADHIKEVMRRCNCPWTIARTYRDDGIKGRYISRRPGLQSLLRDIETGLIEIDLIVVDNLERFGRADEFEPLRQKLKRDSGVLIVAADNNFADPTGITGKAVGMIEQIRSTEEGRIKGLNVIRGKKDTLRLRRWPGGPVPLGYRLKQLIDESGPKPRPYSTLEIDPEAAPIIRNLFQKAIETGWGGTRLAKWMNQDPRVPATLKPCYGSTINYWLTSQIYIGTGRWGDLCTDIINDARVVEPNPHPEEVVVVEGVCEPLVSLEVFNTVQQMISRRSAAFKTSHLDASAAPDGAKLIKPMAGGITLNYALSGLVRCGNCGACCVPRSSGRKSKAGTCYTYFTCPRHTDGACINAAHIREQHLTPTVVSQIRRRLFPSPEQAGSIPEWFPELVHQVQAELDRLRQAEPTQADAMREKIQKIDKQLAGWTMTLGDPNLPATVRQDFVLNYDRAKQEKGHLEAELRSQEAMAEHVRAVLDPAQVLESLKRLDEVLARGNATLANLELARHIDRIDCYHDGSVVLRGTFLGLLKGGVELLGGDREMQQPVPGEPDRAPFARVVPRRLTRRRVPTLSAGQPDGSDDVRALDPRRFAGLADAFIWKEQLQLPKTTSWAEAHAQKVFTLWAADPKSEPLSRLAKHFGVSIPTVREALKKGQAAAGVQVEPRKVTPRGVQDAREIADEAAKLYLQSEPPLTIRQIAEHFKVNQVTVSKALDQWFASRGLERPDGRAARKKRPPLPPVAPGAERPDGPGAP
jgi:site-specific DNA recombinase